MSQGVFDVKGFVKGYGRISERLLADNPTEAKNKVLEDHPAARIDMVNQLSCSEHLCYQEAIALEDGKPFCVHHRIEQDVTLEGLKERLDDLVERLSVKGII